MSEAAEWGVWGAPRKNWGCCEKRMTFGTRDGDDRGVYACGRPARLYSDAIWLCSRHWPKHCDKAMAAYFNLPAPTPQEIRAAFQPQRLDLLTDDCSKHRTELGMRSSRRNTQRPKNSVGNWKPHYKLILGLGKP